MPENYVGFQDPTNYTNLGTSEDAQNKVFGEYLTSDMSDKTQLAYTALMKAQEQAFTTAMYNYNNWYNSDSQRMKRRAQAGLNPYGLDGSAPSNAPSSPSAPVAPRSSGLAVKKQQQTLGAINQLIELAGMANDMYELMTYKGPSMMSQIEANNARVRLSDVQGGRLNTLTPLEAIRLDLANSRYEKFSPLLLSNEQARNDWLLYYIYGPGFGANSPYVETGPRAAEYRNNLALVSSRISQIQELVKSVYPSEVERNKALKALDDYRQSIMEGQNDALLNLSTGNPTADAWIRFLAYQTKDILQDLVPSIGIMKTYK